jgi:hypothetical protein
VGQAVKRNLSLRGLSGPAENYPAHERQELNASIGSRA